MAREKKILLCGGGCQSCPEVEFKDDGTITLSENGQSVVLRPFSLGMLVSEAQARGLLGCDCDDKDDG